MYIKIDSPEEKALIQGLEGRTDSEAERIKRFLSLPDLSRTEGSPLKEIVERTLKVPSLEGFDVIEIPEIIPTNILTNETLATMWRPPSRTIATPGLQRIAATKAPAPPNLPT